MRLSTFKRGCGVALGAALICLTPALSAGTLVGFAVLPASTFVPGPTSGQFISPANGIATPFPGAQPVQGFSGFLTNPDGTYTVLSDNGFGSQGNSPDSLLMFHNVSIDFRTASGGSGGITVNATTFLKDTMEVIGFNAVYKQANYPASALAVDPAIKNGKLLTGADFDPESIRRAKDGTYWFGEEFGPFLFHTDASGKLLEAPIGLPGVIAPQNPFGGTATLGTSRGFEGMAISPDGKTLYPLLEGPIAGDPNNTLRFFEFDLGTKNYSGKFWKYRLDNLNSAQHAIGDFTAISPTQFLVIERDNAQGASAQFKKVFLVDTRFVDANGYVQKTEIVDLLNIADPDDLNLDGQTNFRFPFVTIEGIDIVDPQTLIISNDNNYPFSAGRTPGVADNNEFIKVRLNTPIQIVPEPSSLLLAAAGVALLLVRRR